MSFEWVARLKISLPVMQASGYCKSVHKNLNTIWNYKPQRHTQTHSKLLTSWPWPLILTC